MFLPIQQASQLLFKKIFIEYFLPSERGRKPGTAFVSLMLTLQKGNKVLCSPIQLFRVFCDAQTPSE